MAGGTWSTENKVRPGVYINFESEPKAAGALGERGIVTVPAVLSWGPVHQIITVEAGADTTSVLGYAVTAPQMILVKEALKRAKTLLLYRVNAGDQAQATAENLTITAKYPGVRGNQITVAVEAIVDDPAAFLVKTLVAGKEVNEQTVSAISELAANDWVSFSGTGALTETAGIPLTGGTDGTATQEDYLDYLEAIQVFDFNTMAIPTTDMTLKGAVVSFCKRLREEEGKKIQVVLANYPTADDEGVISVKNGVILADGTVLTAQQATAWVAGATAAAQSNETLTYTAYEEAVDVAPRYTNTEIIAALKAGEFVFTANAGKALVEQDINTLISYTPEKGKAFAKNRVIRVLDAINNDFVQIFSTYYIGKVSNNDRGRNLLKNECVNYLKQLENLEAIQNFDSQTDIQVLAGVDSDSVLVNTSVQPVDSVEKLYFTVQLG